MSCTSLCTAVNCHVLLPFRFRLRLFSSLLSITAYMHLHACCLLVGDGQMSGGDGVRLLSLEAGKTMGRRREENMCPLLIVCSDSIFALLLFFFLPSFSSPCFMLLAFLYSVRLVAGCSRSFAVSKFKLIKNKGQQDRTQCCAVRFCSAIGAASLTSSSTSSCTSSSSLSLSLTT